MLKTNLQLTKLLWRSAGIPGLEPRMTEPETVVLPITPYPNVTWSSFEGIAEAALQ